MATAAPLLAVEGLGVRYGAVAAVQGVDLAVAEGEVVSIVGPNGAGKTSLLSAIAGIVPAAGTIRLGAESLVGLRLEEIVRRGVALVPEGRQIFGSLTVAENLILGTTVRTDRAEAMGHIAELYRTFPILAERRAQPAGRLSGGEQQQLAIARALLSKPRLLLLDEPSLGLAPAIIDRVYETLRAVHAGGVALLLVEQNASRALEISDRTFVMSGGRFRLGGASAELAGHPDFDAAYFGVSMQAG